MTINQRIFHYRKLAGMTQADVAEKMEMKLNAYSKMEREGRITVDRLEKLAEILDIDFEVLARGEKKKPQIEYIPIPIPPIDQPPLIVGQPDITEKKPKFHIPEYIPTPREKATMKIVHNLPKNVQEEIYDFIEMKMNECGKKK